jgi:hypothetical protein
LDGLYFDSVTREMSRLPTRRQAVAGLVAGLVGFGAFRDVDAQTEAEACRVRACRKQTLRQPCGNRRGRPIDDRCCEGLRCQPRRLVCVFERDHGAIGDFCRNRDDCDRDNFCKKNQCVPDSCR